MTDDLQDYIRRHMRHDAVGDFFDVEPLPEYPLVEWDDVPFASHEQMMRPSFPRVVPPRDTREPMAHDGGPGMRDGKHASRIKYLLREWL
jgi:hypothetical protein